MINDKPKELSNFVSPDSLRQFLKMNKKFYNLHTDNDYGSSDENGFQYYGASKNFGSEILIESTKLRMNLPPIEVLDISDGMNFYFDMKYGYDVSDGTNGFIYSDTTRFFRQNMVGCLLKQNTLIDGYTYSIIWNDVSLIYALGYVNSSNGDVFRMGFFKTETPPTLRIVDINGNISNISLMVNDESEINTVYYFPINTMTVDLLNISVTDDDVIRQIDTNHTFTIDINNHKVYNMPYVWFCVDLFRDMSDFTLTNNVNSHGDNLMNIGIDGHNVMHLYPSTGASTHPTVTEQSGCRWYLKARGDITSSRFGQLTQIEYLYADKPNPENPVSVNVIELPDDYTIKPSKNVGWNIRTPQPGEYDYDESSFRNHSYVYVDLSEFDDNIPRNEIIHYTDKLLSAFDVFYDRRLFVGNYENMMNHATTGIHVDYTKDTSDNYVDKIHGIIHDMGEFDGLPRYMKEWNTLTSHRSHVELYSIKDNIINNNFAMNRQTAGLLVDSGIPQTDIDTDISRLNICIEYQGGGLYDTTHESELSKNYLSDLGYETNTSFVDTSMPGMGKLCKFIYHGEGVFSLGIDTLDPELETGRVYLITNDDIKYHNNSDENIPLRTAANISDIPTSYLQLVNIPNYSPTFALDPYYVRETASWNSDEENLVWNVRNKRLVYKVDGYNVTIVSPYNINLNTLYPRSFLEEYYSGKENFGQTLDMSDPQHSTDFTFTVNTGGEGYEVNDEFNVIIGGVNFKGIVGEIDNGSVMYVNMLPNTNYNVYVGNITPNPMICKTATVTGEGDGLTLLLTIDSQVWEDLNIKSTGIFDDIFTLKFDSIGRIWIWKWDDDNSTWYEDSLFLGFDIQYNYYDQELPIEAYNDRFRSLTDVYICNSISCSQMNIFYYDFKVRKEKLSNVISSEYNLNNDLSHVLSEKFNFDETIYIADNSSNTNPNYDLYEYHMSNASDQWNDKNNRYIIPQYHIENTFFAYLPTSKLTMYSIQADSEWAYKQPDLYVYDVTKNKVYNYIQYTNNDAIIGSSHNMIYNDIIDDRFISNKKLTKNVYSFSFNNDIKQWNDAKESLEALSREDLLLFIQMGFGDDVDPIKVEGTTNRYTDQELVDFIMINQVYIRSNITLLAAKESNIDSIDIQQPRGGYTRIQNVYDSKLHTLSGTYYDSLPGDIFKIDADSIYDLNSFRLYDDLGNDVSKYSIILVGNKLYAFDSSSNKWVNIQTNN